MLEDETNREKLRFDFSECVGELNGDLIKERPVVRPGSKVPPGNFFFKLNYVTLDR